MAHVRLSSDQDNRRRAIAKLELCVEALQYILRILVVNSAAKHQDVCIIIDELATVDHLWVTTGIYDFNLNLVPFDLAFAFEDVQYARYVISIVSARIVIGDHAGLADTRGANNDHSDFPGPCFFRYGIWLWSRTLIPHNYC